MPSETGGRVAILDYGVGNLFSVEQACREVGLTGTITSSPREVETAEALVIPGVGAFGDAMKSLYKLDLVSVIQDFAASDRPLFGVCLGIQLLMTESHEFGVHRGLNIVSGEAVRLDEDSSNRNRNKVPQVGWNRILAPNSVGVAAQPGESPVQWQGSPLNGLAHGEFMYFVHSYYPVPEDQGVLLSITRYGDIEFCSSLQRGNIFACQFHPERSGSQGIEVYRNLAKLIAAGEDGFKDDKSA